MSVPTAFVLSHESDPNRQTKTISKIALAIARSLGRHGVPVVRLHPNRMDFGLASRYHRRVLQCPDFYQSEEALVEFLLGLDEYPHRPRVLIPASDDCAYFLGRHHERLSRAFEVLGPQWSVMEQLVNKQRQYEAARKFGIAIPETYFPSDVDEVRQLAAGLKNYPYVIKPLVSHRWRRPEVRAVSKGRKALRATTPQELIAAFEAIFTVYRTVMIQEVIGGRDDRLFTFLSYFNERSEPVAYCIRKKVRQYPVDFGFCTLTVSCRDAEVEQQSIKLLQGVGFHGIAGVEWKLDPRTNEYKLIEINPRAVNTIGLAPACGVDIPYIAFMDKISRNVTPVKEWREGVKWISQATDFYAGLQLYRAGALTLGDWWRSSRGADVHSVFAWDDPRPAIGYGAHFAKRLFKGASSTVRFALHRKPDATMRRELIKRPGGVV